MKRRVPAMLWPHVHLGRAVPRGCFFGRKSDAACQISDVQTQNIAKMESLCSPISVVRPSLWRPCVARMSLQDLAHVRPLAGLGHTDEVLGGLGVHHIHD